MGAGPLRTDAPHPDELSCLLHRLRLLLLQPSDAWSADVVSASRTVAQGIAERLRSMDSDPWVA